MDHSTIGVLPERDSTVIINSRQSVRPGHFVGTEFALRIKPDKYFVPDRVFMRLTLRVFLYVILNDKLLLTLLDI